MFKTCIYLKNERLGNLIGDEELMNIYVTGAFVTRSFSILLQEHGTLIILIYHIISNVATLCFEEIFCPHDVWHSVINSNQLHLS